MRLCIFDLDHTLVRSSLDLAAMALDMRAFYEQACGPLPPRDERYRVGELIAHCQRLTPALETDLWRIALDHERRALDDASLEPHALEAVVGAREIGFATALWTNNAAEITRTVLDRFGMTPAFDVIVTRDEMNALKPDPDGWRVISEQLGPSEDAVVVGDSWVDGLAAAAAGLPFIAYRPRETELERWKVTPLARLDDLGALPEWLASRHARAPRRDGRVPRR